jgi:hypothetical protein
LPKIPAFSHGLRNIWNPKVDIKKKNLQPSIFLITLPLDKFDYNEDKTMEFVHEIGKE